MNVPSVLGMSFVDANFALTWSGLLIQPPTLVLAGGSGSTPMLMADNTFVTADDATDRADSVATTLTAPRVLSQNPPPGTAFTAGQTVITSIIAIGYSVPINAGGTQPVP